MDGYKEMENLTRETMENIVNDWFGRYPELMKYLKAAGFYEYPASVSYHGREEGGLFKHSLQVTYELQRLTEKLGLEWQRKESPVIVGMLHDICKLDDYTITHIPAMHGMDGYMSMNYNQKKDYPGHGDKSLIMLIGLIDLTKEECMCIRYHMGAFTDSKEWEYYSRAVQQYPNVLYTHTADMIASQIKGV